MEVCLLFSNAPSEWLNDKQMYDKIVFCKTYFVLESHMSQSVRSSSEMCMQCAYYACSTKPNFGIHFFLFSIFRFVFRLSRAILVADCLFSQLLAHSLPILSLSLFNRILQLPLLLPQIDSAEFVFPFSVLCLDLRQCEKTIEDAFVCLNLQYANGMKY